MTLACLLMTTKGGRSKVNVATTNTRTTPSLAVPVQVASTSFITPDVVFPSLTPASVVLVAVDAWARLSPPHLLGSFPL